ncbi:MAG: DegT/DnrJ/EryC1/StrS family aminotransferase [Alkalispirochaetaceae bacterium]
MAPLQNSQAIPFARPSLGPEEEEAVLRVMRSGWLTTAGEAAAFEQEFSTFLNASHALAVNSATSGLHLALEALGVGQGDRVAMSPFTFTSCAEVCRYCGAEPFFVDIGEDSLLIDPNALEQRLRHGTGGEGERVKAVMPVHFAGEPCDMGAIGALARSRELRVVEDAAHAFPVSGEQGDVGTLGDVGVFSFYANKTITTGEGGMVITGDKSLADRMRLMRMHGIDRDVWDRYRSPGKRWYYEVVEAGFKYNMPDLLAAIGRVQLSRAEELKESRRRIAERYVARLADREYLRLPRPKGDHAWHLFVIRLVRKELSVDRDEFIRRLGELGIGASVHYLPLHLMPYWRNRLGLTPEMFPRATERYEEVVSLPIWPGMSEEQVERVVEAVRSVGDSAYRRNGR